MFRRISLLNKRGFLPKKENFNKGFLFSPLLIIPHVFSNYFGFINKKYSG